LLLLLLLLLLSDARTLPITVCVIVAHPRSAGPLGIPRRVPLGGRTEMLRRREVAPVLLLHMVLLVGGDVLPVPGRINHRFALLRLLRLLHLLRILGQRTTRLFSTQGLRRGCVSWSCRLQIVVIRPQIRPNWEN
jgi:hypothetical protein